MAGKNGRTTNKNQKEKNLREESIKEQKASTQSCNPKMLLPSTSSLTSHFQLDFPSLPQSEAKKNKERQKEIPVEQAKNHGERLRNSWPPKRLTSVTSTLKQNIRQNVDDR